MKNNKLVVPDDSSIVEATEFAPLPDGVYEFAIDAITIGSITSGAHLGKPVFQVKLKSTTNRVLFKIVPAWTVAGTDARENAWIRMARVSFVEALGIDNATLFGEPESLVGSVVKAVVSSKDNGTYGVQNFVVKFTA